jgi:hypothetical protein
MAEKAADFQEKPIKSLVIKLAGPADLPILPRFLAQADGMGFFVAVFRDQCGHDRSQ